MSQIENPDETLSNKDTDIILMVEADKDINTVKNHKKKLVFISVTLNLK